MTSAFRALRTRNYRLWVSGTVLSNTGTWMQRTAQDWLVLTVLTHHSGLAAGITTGLQFAPLLLLSAHAGVLADRFPKRRVLMCTQTVMGLSALTLGLLVVTGAVELWEVFVCAFGLGLAAAFDNPARQAFASEVVARQDVTSAIGMNSASMNIARLIGPGVAGVLIADFGTGPAFLINAGSFVAVLTALIRMRPAEMFLGERLPRGRGQVREGVRYLRSRPDLLLIFFIAGMVGTFGLNFQITNALMATGAFHRGAREYGLLGSVMAIGSLSAALLAGRRERPRLRLLIFAGLAFGTCMTAGALMPSYPLYAVMLVPIGLCSITLMNSCNTAVQMSTPRHMRGRVIALYVIVFQGTTPLGAPIVGWLGSTFGARWSVLVGGFAALLAIGVAMAVLARRPAIGARFAAALREESDGDADRGGAVAEREPER
ncbi:MULTISPECIES: MFS transporter [unclassified Streptomyces]|uniref:MFS transporter n=1 Tax=unclassified Streptomyces TaxID=2593676 RepID=UPI0005AB523D|nr:MFS transporter [Streptomyces sp. NBC_00370]